MPKYMDFLSIAMYEASDKTMYSTAFSTGSSWEHHSSYYNDLGISSDIVIFKTNSKASANLIERNLKKTVVGHTI